MKKKDPKDSDVKFDEIERKLNILATKLAEALVLDSLILDYLELEVREDRNGGLFLEKRSGLVKPN